MTIASNSTGVTYFGDGVTTAFPFSFPAQLTNDVAVYLNQTLQTGAYSVALSFSGVNPTPVGGTVNFTNPPAVGVQIDIDPAPSIAQATSFPISAPLPSPSIEKGLDRLTMICQMLYTMVKKAFTLSMFAPSNVNLTIPSPTANWLLGWDNSGLNLTNVNPLVAFSNVGGNGGNVVAPDVAPATGALATFASTTGKLLGSGVTPVANGNLVQDTGTGFISAAFNPSNLPAGILKIGGVTRGAGVTTGLRPLLNVVTGLTVTPTGTTGATTWAYKIVPKDATGTTFAAACAAVQTAIGNATLNGTNYNALAWTAVPGATSYDVYRTTAGGTPNTTGKIATVTTNSYNDQGAAGDASSAPTTSVFIGEFWHTGNFVTDAPFTTTRFRLYIDGNFTQQATHAWTISTELPGGIALAGSANGGSGAGIGGGMGSSPLQATATPTAGGGGANGGAGGRSGAYTVNLATATGTAGGAAYFIENQLAGSGGGAGVSWATQGGAGGAGGGAGLINSSGNISLNANITGTGGAGTNGGAGANDGGGGGGSGATLALFAGGAISLGAITINLNGGAGGNGGSSGAPGGGGGGGKAVGRCVGALSNSATITATGGAAGTPGTSCTNGTAGSAGVVDLLGGIGFAIRSAA